PAGYRRRGQPVRVEPAVGPPLRPPIVETFDEPAELVRPPGTSFGNATPQGSATSGELHPRELATEPTESHGDPFDQRERSVDFHQPERMPIVGTQCVVVVAGGDRQIRIEIAVLVVATGQVMMLPATVSPAVRAGGHENNSR